MADPITAEILIASDDTANMLAILSAYSKKKIPELIRERAGTFARYLAENTQPVYGLSNGENPDGGSLKARDLGRGAVRRDMARVYTTASSMYREIADRISGKKGLAAAAKFYSHAKKGNFAEAREIMKAAGIKAEIEPREWDRGRHHQASRNKRGRIGRSASQWVIADAKALREYLKDKQNLVGFTKAAWIAAARQIGSKGLSKVRGWIKDKRAPGTGHDITRNEDNPRVILINAVPWASQALSPSDFARACGVFERALAKELQMAIDAIAKKENERNGH